MNLGQNKRIGIPLALGLVAAMMWAFVEAKESASVEEQVLTACRSTNQLLIVNAEGSNALLKLGKRAIPVLLSWSHGCDPWWHEWANAGRKLLRMPPLQSTWFGRSEDARRAFLVLREHAISAVPELVKRLHSGDRDVRRTSVHMLAAIGPSIGQEAFQQMTNCLADPDPDVRNDVVWAIQYQRPEAYPVETLLDVYRAGLKDKYHVARENAQIGLDRMADGPIPSKTVVELVQRDREPYVRQVADKWLARLRDKSARTQPISTTTLPQ